MKRLRRIYGGFYAREGLGVGDADAAPDAERPIYPDELVQVESWLSAIAAGLLFIGLCGLLLLAF